MSTLRWELDVKDGEGNLRQIPAEWELPIGSGLPGVIFEYCAIAAGSYTVPESDPPQHVWADTQVDGAEFPDWGYLKSLQSNGDETITPLWWNETYYQSARIAKDNEGHCTWKVRVKYRVRCPILLLTARYGCGFLQRISAPTRPSALEEIFTVPISKGDSETVVLEQEIPTPADNSMAWVSGCVPASTPDFYRREWKFGDLSKRGFRAFKPAGDGPQRIYKSQTATGKGSGHYTFTELTFGDGTKDPSAGGENTIDTVTRESGWIMWDIPYWVDPPNEKHTDTLTTRVVPDADPTKPSLTLTLADEYTTAALIAAVQFNANKNAESYAAEQVWGTEFRAWKYTSPCETRRTIQEAKIKLYGGCALHVTDGVFSVTCRWKKTTVDLTTGAASTEEQTQSVSIDLRTFHPPNDPWQPPENDLGLISAEENQAVILHDLKFDYDPIIVCDFITEPPDEE